jgi:hypothetical protein
MVRVNLSREHDLLKSINKLSWRSGNWKQENQKVDDTEILYLNKLEPHLIRHTTL